MKRYKVVHKIMHSEVFYIYAETAIDAENMSIAGDIECDEVLSDDMLYDISSDEEEGEDNA